MKSAFITLWTINFGIIFSILPKPLSGDEEDDDAFVF